MGNKRRAETLLIQGVQSLERNMNPGFAIRAKKMLARFYFAVGNIKQGVRQLAESEALCRKYDTVDQIEDAIPARLVLWLGRKLWRELESLEVTETPNGYEFRPRLLLQDL
jgi:hypothetical protein